MKKDESLSAKKVITDKKLKEIISKTAKDVDDLKKSLNISNEMRKRIFNC